MVSLPISVLAVTLIVNVIKLFDLLYVMTQRRAGHASRVIALHDVQARTSPAGQFGKAAAVAVIMLILLIPVMVFNIRRFRSSTVV